MKKKITALSLLSMLLFTNVWAQGTTDTKIIAYYFLTSYRCSSCYKIEQYTKEAIEQYFSNELKSGALVFKPTNMERKENQHFVKNYQLYSKAVVLSMVNGGKEIKHKNLTKIWEYLRDKDKFYDYIKSETGQFLEEANK
jgi:hypothetical protein